MSSSCFKMLRKRGRLVASFSENHFRKFAIRNFARRPVPTAINREFSAENDFHTNGKAEIATMEVLLDVATDVLNLRPCTHQCAEVQTRVESNLNGHVNVLFEVIFQQIGRIHVVEIVRIRIVRTEQNLDTLFLIALAGFRRDSRLIDNHIVGTLAHVRCLKRHRKMRIDKHFREHSGSGPNLDVATRFRQRGSRCTHSTTKEQVPQIVGFFFQLCLNSGVDRKRKQHRK